MGGVQLRKSGLKQALAYAQLSIMNNFASVDELEEYLGEVDLVNAERLRPGWDTYFMVCLFLQAMTPLSRMTPDSPQCRRHLLH